MNPKFSRKGMILLIVIGCVIFTGIVFMGLVNRVRYESALTARNSVNEMMYQVASSIGRITIRKLHNDFVTMDKKAPDSLMDAVFKNKPFQKKPFTSIICSLDVVKELLDTPHYRHSRGNMTVTSVLCSADFSTGFSRKDPPGMKIPDAQNFERRGNLLVEVTVTYAGFQKKCKVKKPFFVPRLLPAPYFKFTLFSPKGATLPQATVNRLKMVADDGKVSDQDPPLTLLNRLVDTTAPGPLYDFTNQGPNVFVQNSQILEESGWIYLGGIGSSRDSMQNTALYSGQQGFLSLNDCAGLNPGYDQKYLGEGFHHYFNTSSFGWLCADDYSIWLNGGTQPPSPGISLAYVDFGFFTGQKSQKFSNNLFLFKNNSTNGDGIYQIWKDAFQSTGEIFDQGSALRLYGTPGLCTPTLIFGKVKRRFLRTYGMFFQMPGFSRIFPFRYYLGKNDWEANIATETLNWVAAKPGGAAVFPTAKALLEKVLKVPPTTQFQATGILDNQMYSAGPGNLPPLTPQFIDYEPYMESLRNIKKPGAPEELWATMFSSFKYIAKGNDALFQDNPTLSNDPETFIDGDFSKIGNPADYYKERVSYLISDPAIKKYQLSKIPFIQQKFLKTSTGICNEPLLFLNEVIQIDGDLEIDKDIVVAKGGIILVNGTIDIKARLINAFHPKYPNKIPDPAGYGYITLITSKEVSVDIPPTGADLPQFDGFIICMNPAKTARIDCKRPFHLIGGACVDDISSLVTKGSIIEWGFHVGDTSTVSRVAKGAFLSDEGFYGLAMGPRDIEVVDEN